MASLPRRTVALGCLAGVSLVACGDADTTDGDATDDAVEARDPDTGTGEGDATLPATPPDCVVRLHGKGGDGDDPRRLDDDTVELLPTGNAEGWGARQWLYFPDDRYAEAVEVVRADLDATGCGRVVVNGFSNGAAFAGALLCRGETFDGRVVGVVIDDPVTDRAVEACEPAPDVEVALYWTGGLDEQSAPGTDCAPMDWTCAGGTLVGIEAYAAAIGTEVLDSPFDDHEWFWDAPEVRGFLTRAG